jgi:methylthioribose-1-phosphate isomerase
MRRRGSLSNKGFTHIVFDDKSMTLHVLDQRLLPTRIRWFKITDATTAYTAIKNMIVRGAPLIGVVGAYGLTLELFRLTESGGQANENKAREIAGYIASARPTAVNLRYCVERVLNAYLRNLKWEDALEETERIVGEEEEASYMIGVYGAKLLADDDKVLTHCNAGALATIKYGTALAPIRLAVREGKKISVIVTETRPVLQGARLTAFELARDGIPVTLVSDTAVGYLMWKGLVDKVIVGADRVLATGHTFNKIGTYQIAILAKKHSIPFYVALPTSTFDLSSSLDDVVIEERDPKEVTHIKGRRIAPSGIRVMNPAFDVTPPDYITAFITEKGIIDPPFHENITAVVKGAKA